MRGRNAIRHGVRIPLIGLTLALGAAAAYAFRPILIKAGLEQADIPLAASIIGAFSALAYTALREPRENFRVTRLDAAFWWFLVGGAVHEATLHAATGQPPREGGRMVPAARGHLADPRRTAEFRRHHHQRAVQEAVPVLVTLRADQLRALEKRLAKDEARYIEQWMSGDEKSRHRKRVHRMVERFEEWAGELDSRQRSLVDRFVASHSAIYELRLNDRRRWQREAVSMIRQQRTVSTLSPPLSRLFVDPDASRNIEVSRELQRWESDFANMIVELDASMPR